MSSSSDSRCFLDVSMSGQPVGRIVVALDWSRVPRTCSNFRALCTGEAGMSRSVGKPMHYLNTCFHRVIKGFMIQSGDFVNNNGTGGESIYGPTFDDEDLTTKHDRPYLLSMANKGKNSNGSQFFITTNEAPHLDGLHVVFGHVVNGVEVVKVIENADVDNKDRPLQQIKIVNCGELVKMNKAKKEAKKETKKEAKKSKKAKKRRRKNRDRSSSGSSGEEDDGKEKQTRSKESRKKRKAEKEEKSANEDDGEIKDDEEELEAHPLVQLSNIDPDDIPEVPSNRFLMRATKEDSGEKRRDKERRSREEHRSRGRREDRETDRRRRVIKGRGNMQFERNHRSRSRTPPHWKSEQRRTISLADFQRQQKEKKAREEEMKRRAEERERRHQQQERERALREQEERERRERRPPTERYESNGDSDQKDDDESDDEDKRSRRTRRFEEFKRNNCNDAKDKNERQRSNSRPTESRLRSPESFGNEHGRKRSASPRRKDEKASRNRSTSPGGKDKILDSEAPTKNAKSSSSRTNSKIENKKARHGSNSSERESDTRRSHSPRKENRRSRLRSQSPPRADKGSRRLSNSSDREGRKSLRDSTPLQENNRRARHRSSPRNDRGGNLSNSHQKEDRSPRKSSNSPSSYRRGRRAN